MSRKKTKLIYKYYAFLCKIEDCRNETFLTSQILLRFQKTRFHDFHTYPNIREMLFDDATFMRQNEYVKKSLKSHKINQKTSSDDAFICDVE